MQPIEYEAFTKLLRNLGTKTTANFFGYSTSDVIVLLLDKYSSSPDCFAWSAHFGRMGFAFENNIKPEEVSDRQILNETIKALRKQVALKRVEDGAYSNAKLVRLRFNQEKYTMLNNESTKLGKKISERTYDSSHTAPKLSSQDIKTGKIISETCNALQNSNTLNKNK